MDTVTSCNCGGESFHADGSCRACYMRAWRRARKVAGAPSRSPSCNTWFDWQAVKRAAAGEPVGRKLTQAERIYLAERILSINPDWSETEVRPVLGLDWGVAAAFMRDVASGRLRGIPRDWQGSPA